jgi:hypothetical protein
VEIKFEFGYEVYNHDLALPPPSAIALYLVIYSERFAYYCGSYFTPFRPSNYHFGYIEEGVSMAGYTFTHCMGSFVSPGKGTRNLGFVSHSKDAAIEEQPISDINDPNPEMKCKVTCPRLKSMKIMEPTMLRMNTIKLYLLHFLQWMMIVAQIPSLFPKN